MPRKNVWKEKYEKVIKDALQRETAFVRERDQIIAELVELKARLAMIVLRDYPRTEAVT